MYSLFVLYYHYFYKIVNFYAYIQSTYTVTASNSKLNKTPCLSISIFAIVLFLPVPVQAHLTSKEFPMVVSETSPPQMIEKPVNTPILPSRDNDQPPIPTPTPTTSPSIPQIPEDIPEIPQVTPKFSPPEEIQPSESTPEPTLDIPDDIPRPVPSNILPSSNPEKSSPGNLLEVAATSNSLNIFARAIEAAGLTDTLIEDSFTIFVPTNEAFSASLPSGAIEFLLQPENKYLLQKLLRYHIIKGEVAAKELTTGKLDTLGGSIAVRVTPQRIILNNSSITHSDIQATNGVIHSINRVLIPRQLRNTITNKMSEKSDVEGS